MLSLTITDLKSAARRTRSFDVGRFRVGNGKVCAKFGQFEVLDRFYRLRAKERAKFRLNNNELVRGCPISADREMALSSCFQIEAARGSRLVQTASA